jgi:UDP-galactopyranose mutase
MTASDLVCLSHLRWNHVFQRPNHLMSRAARDRRVFYVEEPEHGPSAGLRMSSVDGVTVVVPILPDGLESADETLILTGLVADLFRDRAIHDPWLWYYTPLALAWTGGLPRSVVVYDCMDELSAFRFAAPDLVARERELIDRADVMFTGGRSLFEAKRALHPNIHVFPSSVDTAHFGQARMAGPDPADQASVAHPRIGYFGVIDERIDLGLLAAAATARPDWQLVLVGPVAKVDPADLPQAPNIHWLGRKEYADLPAYLAGWDVAVMPFAINESTRFISPTKTPEYLAGGVPVVSTAIADVVDPYGDAGLVSIASDAGSFVDAIEHALRADPAPVIARADQLLAAQSWDKTWKAMSALIEAQVGVPTEGPAAEARSGPLAAIVR